MIDNISYRIALILFLYMLSHKMVLAGNTLDPIDAQPVWNFSKTDSASATLSYVMGASSNNNNKIKIHIDEVQRLTLYCRNFTYKPGVNGKKLGNNDYQLILNLAQESKGDVEYPYSYSIPFGFKQSGDAVICNNKCTIDLIEGDYTISYLGFLGFLKEPDEPIHFFSPPFMTINNISTIVLTCSAGDIKEDTTSFTPAYPSVHSADITPCVSHKNNSNKNYVVSIKNRVQDRLIGDKVITYFDGFGRPIETVNCNASPNKNNWATYTEYNCFNKPIKEWLNGVVSQDAAGNFVIKENLEAASVSSNNDAEPYSVYEYEASPLMREAAISGPGEDWHNRGKKKIIQYLTNTQNNPDSQVWHLSVLDKTGLDCSIKANGLYQTGTLKGVLTKDEDDCMSIEFKNRQGNIVLSRQFDNEGGRVDTYYVYDDYGLLRAVLPAMVSTSITKGEIDEDRINLYAYLYQYDSKDRLIGKKLPGIEWKTMEYDNYDRLVSEQDGVQRKDGEKTFHLYDVHGRECLTGIATAETDLKKSTVFYDGKDEFTNGYQCSTSAYSGIMSILKTYYYDNYDFAKGCDLPIGKLGLSGSNIYQGKLVGMKALRLKKEFFPIEYDTHIYAYDYRGLTTGTLKSNHLEGYNLEHISYNFNGQPLKRYMECAPFYDTADFRYEYHYDIQGRLRREDVVVNYRKHLTIADNQYDELGRLVNDSRTGAAALNTTYSYNVRSQLTGISSPIFSEKLYYNSNPYESKSSYNGNISAHSWEIAPYQEGYSYEYDKLSRLTKAKYYSGTTPSNKYTSNYDYDSMGNILSLQCNRLLDNGQWGLGDDIAYSYIGNQLYKADNQASQPSYVSHYFFSDNVDLETEYAYDENGNMTKNLNKNIDSITYNEIGMPRCISFKGGGKTEYIYSATGEKLQVKHTPSIGDKAIITNYCGEAVFDDINLETVFFDGGYMSYKHTSKPVFYHYVKDYQGSNRVIYNAKNDEAIQWISYYPFGSILNSNQDVDFQRYFYNGKELESLQGLFLYDYGARFYDGIRFTTMDPLAEKYYSISPYAYCGNNPINAVDLNGASIYMLFYSTGNQRINKDGDEEFRAAAYTRKYDIEHSKGFDKNRDIVLALPFDDITKLSQIVEDNVTEYSGKYGKTKEVGFWSHAGFDGPIGTINAIGADDVIEDKQLSISAWGKINFNWDKNAAIGFYGCNTGVGDSKNFARNISKNTNMKNVNVYGQPKSAVFSGSSTQATYSSEKLTNNGVHFKRTYLVSSEMRKMYWWLNSGIKRMKWYNNGKIIR